MAFATFLERFFIGVATKNKISCRYSRIRQDFHPYIFQKIFEASVEIFGLDIKRNFITFMRHKPRNLSLSLGQRNQCRRKSLFKFSSNFIKDDFGHGEIKAGKFTCSQKCLGTSRPEVSSIYENICVEKYRGHTLLPMSGIVDHAQGLHDGEEVRRWWPTPVKTTSRIDTFLATS